MVCFVQNFGRFLMPIENTGERSSVVTDKSVTSANEASAVAMEADGNGPDCIPSETNSEVDGEFISADDQHGIPDSSDGPDVAQKHGMQRASAQGNKSDSHVTACQSLEQEKRDSCLPDNVAGDANTTADKVCQPSVLNARKDGMVTYCDKRPYCLFCGEPQSKIQRHWLSKHREEREVIELMSLRDRTERVRRVTRLRNLGNHRHNKKVLETGRGEFLVTYRRKRDATASEYVPCKNCWAYVLKVELFRHRCKFPKKETRVQERRAAEAKQLLPPPKETSAEVQKLSNGMMFGSVRVTCRLIRTRNVGQCPT